jgi:PAS domain S-box-containing protein
MKIERNHIKYSPATIKHLFIATICAICFGFSAETSATQHSGKENLEKVAIQLKWKHQFQFAGFYTALEKGYYQQAGLNVTIIEGGPGIDFIDTVVSGKAQYGVEMPNLLLRRAAGEPIVLLACIYQHSPLTLMSLAKSNIHTPHDLIGRKIMLRTKSSADLLAMISQEGIEPGAIEIIEHTFNIENLIEGKVDAMSLYSTDYAGEFKKRQIEFNSLAPYHYGIDFYGDCLFTSEEEIEKHTDRVKAFRAASLKGWEYAMNNPQEIARLVHEKYAPNKSVEMLFGEAEQMAPLLLHKVVEIGHINPGRWKHIADTFVSQGMLKPDYSLEGFIYNPTPNPDYRWFYAATGLLLGIAFVGVMAKIWNKNLRKAVVDRTRELKESAAEHRELTESLPQKIFHKDIDLVYVSCNKHYAEDMGIDAEKIAGKTDFEFYPKELAEKYRADDRRVMESGQTEEIEESYVKDGQELFVQTVKTPLKDEDGNVTGILGIFWDITHRKLAEQQREQLVNSLEFKNKELRENREKHERLTQDYQTLFREMLDGFALHEIICDDHGKPIDYRFLAVNPPFEQMTGLKAQDVTGKTVLEVLPGTEQRWIDTYGKVALTGEPIFFENHSQELGKHFEVTAFRPATNQFACIFADITKRKHAEAEREQLVKTLEFKNKELQDVVYTASHDLRSPLVNIQGFSSVLATDCDNLLDLLGNGALNQDQKHLIEPLLKESIPQSLGFITSSARKMASLLDGLLQVSRIGSVKINKKPVDVNRTTKEVLSTMEYQIKENNITVTAETLPDCIGDINLMDHVLSNLIGNAIKYRNTDKQTQIKISGKVEDNMSIYCVEDNGIGIAADYQKKVFEIFHRLDPNDNIGGEGLGLTIVMRILERLGGNIWLESQPNKGCKFFFALPKA